MDNFSGSSGGREYPLRNSSGSFNRTSSFNDPPGGGERAAPMPPMQPYANGMLSRPGAGGGSSGSIGMPALQRDDSLASINGGGSRTQQASHEVFMVREAGAPVPSSRSNDRSSYPSGNRFPQETESVTGGERGGEYSNQNAKSTSHTTTTSHHRGERERDKDKEKDSTKLVFPKMLKIAVVGDSTAGKTAICNAFTSEGYNFSRNYHMTTGVSIYAKSIKLPTREAGGSTETGGSSTAGISSTEDPLLEPRINLVLVDSAGKDIYRELLPQYWERLNGLALVIDLTSSSTLQTAVDWLNLAKGCISSTSGSQNQSKHHHEDGSGDQSSNTKREQTQQPFLGVLIGSKNDLKDQRVISPKAAQNFAAQHGLQYFECSAKENSGMEEPFFFLAHQWTIAIQSSAGGNDKENIQEGAGGSGGIFGVGRNAHISSSRRSAFASRQSSSEAF
ncbi:Intraflagellar transport protein 27 [Orchesella cincta]|uniref:Intraflagellar transport protein 27 n=1 Tax=Orchesella cincta TaxID=48709 RepID=A0A1D2N908_ORCCI|nr:Intraflagellar transport protein 27 [Orchesella cincta]